MPLPAARSKPRPTTLICPSGRTVASRAAILQGPPATDADKIKHGLVDKIGFLEDAVDRAIELAGLTKDDVQVVKYKKPVSFLDDIALMQSRASRGPLCVDDLLEMSTPRAYYLVTSLPALASSKK